jgi:hypothetical protein
MPGKGKVKRKRNKSSPNQASEDNTQENTQKRYKLKQIIETETETGLFGENYFTPLNSPLHSDISDCDSDFDSNPSKMCSKKELEEVISKLKIDLIQDLKAEFELIVETKT